MGKLKICEKCGFSVEWRQNKSGKWYLVSDHAGKRGNFTRIPHYLECETKQETRKRWEEEDKK